LALALPLPACTAAEPPSRAPVDRQRVALQAAAPLRGGRADVLPVDGCPLFDLARAPRLL
jgi:hypothetical protein